MKITEHPRVQGVSVRSAAVGDYFQSITDSRVYFFDSCRYPDECWLTSVDFPVRRISISSDELARRFTRVSGPYGPASDLPTKIQTVLNQLAAKKRYTSRQCWRVWKEATCETIFERHGPQWEDEDEKARFAENELRGYFEENLSPAEAEQEWWRKLCDSIPRQPSASQQPEKEDDEEFSLANVYDCVLLRTAREMKERLHQLEEQSPERTNRYVDAMRRSLVEMETELARRGMHL